jgi:hypothetical protein
MQRDGRVFPCPSPQAAAAIAMNSCRRASPASNFAIVRPRAAGFEFWRYQAYCFEPADKGSPNAAAAAPLSITIKSLSWRLRPDAEKFAALIARATES